jgi:uroporphyrin-3 C-methyltransferase
MKNNNIDKNKTKPDQVTEAKTELSSDPVAEDKTVISSTPSSKLKSTEKKLKNMPEIKAQNTSISKTALLAIFLSLTAIGSVAGLYYFDQQARNVLSQQFSAKNELNNVTNQQKVTQLLAKQELTLLQTFESELSTIKQANQLQLTRLSNTVEKLQQKQPSDWLIHEAEYLIRIAGRTLWLERDTKAAIALLQDADQRLQSLKDPNYLLVRQAINNDVAALKLVPGLKTEATILTLMAMSKEIASLKLIMIDIPEGVEESEDLALSNNSADWQENLSKTWKKFLADFITVNRRETQVEPLMSINTQQHLRENLRLKLQVAQWAVSQEKQQLYLQTLSDIEAWLNEYFIIDNSINQSFLKSIEQLKRAQVTFDYNQGLSSLGTLRAMMLTPAIAKMPVTAIKDLEDKNLTIDNQKVVDEGELGNHPNKPVVEKPKVNKASHGEEI